MAAAPQAQRFYGPRQTNMGGQGIGQPRWNQARGVGGVPHVVNLNNQVCWRSFHLKNKIFLKLISLFQYRGPRATGGPRMGQNMVRPMGGQPVVQMMGRPGLPPQAMQPQAMVAGGQRLPNYKFTPNARNPGQVVALPHGMMQQQMPQATLHIQVTFYTCLKRHRVNLIINSFLGTRAFDCLHAGFRPATRAKADAG